MEFTRDQRRTLMRTGRVTIREVVELDVHMQVTPCGHRLDAAPVPVYTDRKRKDDALARVLAVDRDAAHWVVTYSLVFERERPRFLAKAGGYTDVPALGLADEPQAVPEAYQDRLVALSEDRNYDIKRQRIADMRQGINHAAAGLDEASMDRLDRKDLERIEFYMKRIEDRAGFEDAA